MVNGSTNEMMWLKRRVASASRFCPSWREWYLPREQGRRKKRKEKTQKGEHTKATRKRKPKHTRAPKPEKRREVRSQRSQSQRASQEEDAPGHWQGAFQPVRFGTFVYRFQSGIINHGVVFFSYNKIISAELISLEINQRTACFNRVSL